MRCAWKPFPNAAKTARCRQNLHPRRSWEERMRTIGHFIGGREVNGASGRTADVFEPMTGEVQAKVDLASKAEVRAAVKNALAAQVEWGATNPQRRATMTNSPICWPASMARPFPTPRATFSAALRWSSLPAAFRT